MNTLDLIAVAAAALFAGLAALLGWLWSRERSEAAVTRSQLETARVNEARWSAQVEHLNNTASHVENAFKAMSGEAMAQASQALLKQAEEAFVARDRLVQDRLASQLKPVAETLARFEEKVQAIDKARAAESGGLKEQIESLLKATTSTHEEARRLSSALQRGAGIQGRWGEQMLRNVLEMSGLRPGVDFEEQVSTTDEDGASRPDVLVRLPGKSYFIVDSKVSLTDYQAFLAETDEPLRETALKAHVESIRRHLRQLSAKAYWAKFDRPPHSRSPDVVVMFVPSESAFACAVERYPTLVAEGWESRVAIVTPSAMFPLLRAVAYGWRAEDQAANAREIADAGRELHRRVATVAKYAFDLGGALEKAVRHYNEFSTSLDRNVLTQAKRFEALSANSDKTLAEPPVLDIAVRPPLKLVATPEGDEGPQTPALTLGNAAPTSPAA
jgi:DNA recombination protein RmuC